MRNEKVRVELKATGFAVREMMTDEKFAQQMGERVLFSARSALRQAYPECNILKEGAPVIRFAASDQCVGVQAVEIKQMQRTPDFDLEWVAVRWDGAPVLLDDFTSENPLLIVGTVTFEFE